VAFHLRHLTLPYSSNLAGTQNGTLAVEIELAVVLLKKDDVMDNREQGDEGAGSSAARFVRLRSFDNAWFSRGRSMLVEAMWLILSAAFVTSWIPGSAHRCLLLRAFGARIGKRVSIKPGVRIKFPWRLEIGDDSWLGEDVWIDNLAPVQIGSNCCISQGAYICTGSHDWSSPAFDLIIKPVRIENCAWVAAQSAVSGGVTVGEGAVLSLRSLATSDLAPWGVYCGVPAEFVKERLIRTVHQSRND
jgi:putative colanic acid biosynthesis acetyltransferase WcaF